MRQLRDGDDLRVAVDAAHERVLHRLADALGKGEELVGPEVLVAEEHDEVVEPRAWRIAAMVVVGKVTGEVDAADLGAERIAEGHDLERPQSVTW